jgi:long-subunit fatty acid transport protein
VESSLIQTSTDRNEAVKISKMFFFAAVVAIVLSACSKERGADEAGPAAAGTAETSPTEVPSRAPEKGIDVLVGLGFKPGYPYSVAYDIIDKNDAGTSRHRVLLEVLDGDIVDAMRDSEETLIRAGYAKAKETGSDGRYDAIFTRHGWPTLVFMGQTAERGPPLKTPGAVGTIHIMWNFY